MNRLLHASSRVPAPHVLVIIAAIMVLAPAAPAKANDADTLSVAGNSGPYGPRERAEELYLDAMEKLQAGRRAWAQRTFESLIARYPGTPAAERARRKLSELYGDDGQRAVNGSAGRSSPAPLIAPQFPPTARKTIPKAKWDREMRRSARVQENLRSEAGDRVFFSSGSAALGSKARTALAAQARWLSQHHGLEVTIEGHADEPGTDEQNMILSAQRAEAVRQRLIEEGVAPARIEIVARGRTQRVSVCNEPECRAQNRRVITIVFVSGTHKRLGQGATPSASNGRAQKQGLVPARPVSATRALERLGLPR